MVLGHMVLKFLLTLMILLCRIIPVTLYNVTQIF